MSKYYILEDRYILRGWKHTGRVLIRRPNNAHKFLKEMSFRTLLLCDGQTDFEASFITDEMRDLAERLEKKGIIRRCEKGTRLTEDQVFRFYDNRFVERVMWSVTGCCNYRCRHCFMDAPDGVLGQLPTKRALEIVDEIAECGILRVHITGGEPLIRPDFWQIIDRFRFHKIYVQVIFTNGALLTEKMLDGFAERNMKPQFSVSFDGLGWHDWMRGVKGAEAAALDAMKRAAARGHIVNASICVHKGNLPVLWETVEKLAEIGVRKVTCSSVSETELWKEQGKEYHLDQKEYAESMLPLIGKFYEAGMPVNLSVGGIIEMKKDSEEYRISSEAFPEGFDCSNCYLCEDARFAAYIAPDGQLLPCLPMTGASQKWLNRFPRLGDISLKEGLSDSFYMEFVSKRIRELFNENRKCGTCEFRFRCGGGCRAAALLDAGDLLGADPEMCFMLRNHYPERIRKIADDAIQKRHDMVSNEDSSDIAADNV